MERLLGHATHIMMLRRELLSMFRCLYDFVQGCYEKKTRLWPSAVKEARWASKLLLLCTVDLRRPWSTTLTASDASLSGLAVCRSESTSREVAGVGNQREPWRYKQKMQLQPRARALDETDKDPFNDITTVKPIGLAFEDPYELNDQFEEVPPDMLASDRWVDAFAIHMQHPEHITLLEGRGVVAALRHKFRSVHEFGRKHLHLNDNMSVVLMCSKGRSGAFSMLRVCRRLAALLLATDSLLVTRWIPSEKNIADRASRQWESLRRGLLQQHAIGEAQQEPQEAESRSSFGATFNRSSKIGLLSVSASQESGPENHKTHASSSERSHSESRSQEEDHHPKDRPCQVSRTDEPGETGCLSHGWLGLCTKNQGLPALPRP